MDLFEIPDKFTQSLQDDSAAFFSPLFLQGTIVIGRNDYYYYQAVIDRGVIKRAINLINLLH